MNADIFFKDLERIKLYSTTIANDGVFNRFENECYAKYVGLCSVIFDHFSFVAIELNLNTWYPHISLRKELNSKIQCGRTCDWPRKNNLIKK